MPKSMIVSYGLVLSLFGLCASLAPRDAGARAVDQVEPKSIVVSANGLKFPTLVWGPAHGRAVLLLHGFPQEARTWDHIARGLANAGFRVVAFDQRGYATTTRPGDVRTYNFDQFVSDAIAVADACKFERFDVAGFGMGGAEAWILGARYPARIRSVVALRFPHPAAFAGGIRNDPSQAASWEKLQQSFGQGTTADRVEKMLRNNAEGLRAFLAKNGLPQPWLDRYVKRLQVPGALAGALSWEPAVVLDDFAAVPTVTVPAYFLWSEGPALTAATARATGRYVSAAFRMEELEGAGHFFIETSSDSVLTKMLSFLAETHVTTTLER